MVKHQLISYIILLNKLCATDKKKEKRIISVPLMDRLSPASQFLSLVYPLDELTKLTNSPPSPCSQCL